MAAKLCKKCGKSFDIPIPWNRGLCSKDCIYRNQLDLARAQSERKRNQPITRPCRQCGIPVVSNAWCVRNFCEGKSGGCYRAFLSANRRGARNPSYRNGFAVEGKRTYTGMHLRACKKYRKAFLEKHAYPFCEVCGVNANGTPKFEVHHIYFASLYPKHKQLHNFKNLVHICIRCHNNFHGYKLPEVFKRLEAERGLKALFAK